MSGAAIHPAQPGDLDRPFWDGCRAGRFQLHVCGLCQKAYWPASCCTVHGASAMEWKPASGRGTVDTFTVFHRIYRPELSEKVPYVVAVIRLEEGPYFHTNIVDGDWRDVAVGKRVEWIGPGEESDGDRAMFRLSIGQ